MKYYFYISDDKTHDNDFVQHCLLLHWKDIVNGGFRPKRWIWFDGCASTTIKPIPITLPIPLNIEWEAPISFEVVNK
jgi:hypothetical protein